MTNNPFQFTPYMAEGAREQYLGMFNQAGAANQMAASSGTGRFGQAMSQAGGFATDNIVPIGQAATGLVGVADSLFGRANVVRDEVGNQMGTDLQGRPIMRSQAYQSSIDRIQDNARGEVGRSMGQGALSGAKGGAAIGSMIAPGIGTAIGAGIGAIGGGVAGLIGGSRRKRKMLDEVRSREGLLHDSFMKFNEDNRYFFEQDMARDINQFQLGERSRRVGQLG